MTTLIQKIREQKPNWPTPIQRIGGGANGNVYMTNSGKLMKVTRNADPMEFRALARLQKTGIVPTFNNKNWIILGKSKKGTKRTAFLMGKIGGPDDIVTTLRQYVHFIKQTNLPLKYEWKDKVARLIRIMHAHGVSHGDLHPENILVAFNPNTQRAKFYVIDFGRATFFDPGNTEMSHYRRFRPAGMFKTRLVNNNTKSVPIQLYVNEKGTPRRMNVEMARSLYTSNNTKSSTRSVNIAKARIRALKKSIGPWGQITGYTQAHRYGGSYLFPIRVNKMVANNTLKVRALPIKSLNEILSKKNINKFMNVNPKYKIKKSINNASLKMIRQFRLQYKNKLPPGYLKILNSISNSNIQINKNGTLKFFPFKLNTKNGTITIERPGNRNLVLERNLEHNSNYNNDNKYSYRNVNTNNGNNIMRTLRNIK